MFRWNSIKVSLLILIYHKLTNYLVRYFVTMLIYFSSAPFYTNNVHLPHDHILVPPETLSSFPSSRTCSRWHTSTAMPQLLINKQLMIAKGLWLKTALQSALSTWGSSIFSVAGMGLPQTQPCFMMPTSLIFFCTWKVLFSWCWISYLWDTPHPFSRCPLSSYRMGPSPASVNIYN